jgi:hypothetical protein
MPESLEIPLYESKGTPRSLWNAYRIFGDRIELQFRMFFTTIVIPREAFVAVDIFKPPVIRTVFWALKLDFADLFTHVGIERNCGMMKKVLLRLKIQKSSSRRSWNGRDNSPPNG